MYNSTSLKSFLASDQWSISVASSDAPPLPERTPESYILVGKFVYYYIIIHGFYYSITDIKACD